MKSSIKSIRIRYDEVDKMGFVYHGNYARYYHIGRTQLLKNLGISDKALESQNIIIPVVEMNIRYLKPVFYDDLIRIKTTLKVLSGVKLKFHHSVYNQDNEIINKADSTLVFVNSKSNKAVRIPKSVMDRLES